MNAGVLRIGVVYPTVLGTYGDGGNAMVLQRRAELRGIPAEIVPIELGQVIPSDLDIYTMGGGEDKAQALAAEHLAGDPGLARAAERGAPILAICASMQLLGNLYTDASGKEIPGLGLLDITTTPRGSRAIGELVTKPLLQGLTEPLVGFENHGGGTCLGSDASPLGMVLVGVGNGCTKNPGTQNGFEGAVQGSIIGTYMHGPVLARNPELADFLLSRVAGELTPLELGSVGRLRRERLDAAGLTSNTENQEPTDRR